MKKKPVLKPPTVQEKDLYNAFLKRFRTACDLMVGKDFFATIPNEHLPQLFQQRLPPLKLEFPLGVFTKEQETNWQTHFRLRLTDLSFKTLTGETMPVADYFRDGILLATYADTLYKRNSNLFVHGKVADTYGICSPIFLQMAEKIMQFINSLCIIYGDINGKALLTDYSSTSMLVIHTNADNKIKLSTGRPNHERLMIDGKTRELTALCWPDIYGKLKQVTVVPSKLGFPVELSKPVPVFFQQHAAGRLIERLAIQGGILLYILECLFHDQTVDFYLVDGNLLPLSVLGKKVGYLAVDLVEDKIVIRTFLFLTNDGTPEGRKLAELTKLKKLDKQYLGIDTLTGFRSLNIIDDPILKPLFTEAGCGDLLDLQNIDMLLQTSVSQRNTDNLLRYLQDSPFMKRK